jgi:hypothetical protein
MKKGPFGLRIFFRVLMILFVAGTVCLYCPAFASGANRYVAKSGSADSGDCASVASPCLTIGYAINQANSGDTIRISAGTYNEHDLNPAKDLNFYGAGMNDTILDGTNSGKVIMAGSYNIVINDMTIRNGNGSDGGGIEQTGGTLLLTRVKVTNNTSSGGGGIYSAGQLNMTDCDVSSNTAYYAGGGLYLETGATGNLARVTISGNTSAGYGAGIFAYDSTSLNLTNVTISGNTGEAYAAICTGTAVTINILNSTITGNNFIAGKYCGGIAIWGGTTTIKNTIISGNGSDDSNCCSGSSATIVSQGNNLDSSDSCNFRQIGDLHDTAPQLVALADNGGPTQTHALNNTSPAIDVGTNTGCPATDQRGMLRPQGTKCDIGAYEYSSCPNKPVHIDGTSSYYDFIGQAYDAVQTGHVILMQVYQISEAVSFGLDKIVTLKGGYGCSFGANLGSYSTIYGSLTISGGKVTVENVKIK